MSMPTPFMADRRIGKALANLLMRNHIWVFLTLAILVFSFSSPYFLTLNNLGNVLTQGAFIGILAVGMTMVMINGEIDLSVGATLALASALAIGLQDSIGVWPAVFTGFLSGVALGALNGTLVALSGMHSFIVTLGALIGIRGLVFVYSGENALMVTDFSYTEYPEIYLGPVSLTAGFGAGTLNPCRASERPADSASRSAGTNPAADTRFASSNTARTV